MSGKTKVEKLDGESAKIAITEYLCKEYRPYAVTDLLLNLHNRISKSVMLSVLEAGVQSGEFIEKRYGKLVYYCYAEKKVSEGLVEVTLGKVQEVQSEVKVLEKELAEVGKKLNILNNIEGDAELINKIAELEQRINELQQEISVFEASGSMVEKDSAIVEEQALQRQVQRLSRMQDAVLSALQDGMEMSHAGFKVWVRDLGVDI